MNPWDERYSASEYIYGTEPNFFLKESAHLIPIGPVLCLADGEGRNGVYLASQGQQVTSVDSSAVALEKARRLAEKKGVSIKTIHADLALFDFPENHYTGIVSIFCHLPPELRQSVLRKCVTALKPGGIFLSELYRPEQLRFNTGGPPTSDLLVSTSQLQEDLQGLAIVHSAEVEREVIEGSYHTGRAAVSQFIARKPA